MYFYSRLWCAMQCIELLVQCIQNVVTAFVQTFIASALINSKYAWMI